MTIFHMKTLVAALFFFFVKNQTFKKNKIESFYSPPLLNYPAEHGAEDHVEKGAPGARHRFGWLWTCGWAFVNICQPVGRWCAVAVTLHRILPPGISFSSVNPPPSRGCCLVQKM
jgi:hypothetical protein